MAVTRGFCAITDGLFTNLQPPSVSGHDTRVKCTIPGVQHLHQRIVVDKVVQPLAPDNMSLPRSNPSVMCYPPAKVPTIFPGKTSFSELVTLPFCTSRTIVSVINSVWIPSLLAQQTSYGNNHNKQGEACALKKMFTLVVGESRECSVGDGANADLQSRCQDTQQRQSYTWFSFM